MTNSSETANDTICRLLQSIFMENGAMAGDMRQELVSTISVVWFENDALLGKVCLEKLFAAA